MGLIARGLRLSSHPYLSCVLPGLCKPRINIHDPGNPGRQRLLVERHGQVGSRPGGVHSDEHGIGPAVPEHHPEAAELPQVHDTQVQGRVGELTPLR